MGEWRAGERHGRGVQRHPDGAVYDGEWAHGAKQGEGRWVELRGRRGEAGTTEQAYQGGYQSGVRHGVAAWRGAHGDAYNGHCREGTMGGGAGRFVWGDDGERYGGTNTGNGGGVISGDSVQQMVLPAGGTMVFKKV